MCWDQDLPLQPYESWFLASPSCFPPNHPLLPSKICERVIVCWGDYLLKHKSKEFIIVTTSITFWRVVSPRLVRCRLEASVFVCGVEPRSLYRQGDRLLREDLPRVRLVLHGRRPSWNIRGCYFVDPSWVDPSVDSRDRYPSWVEVWGITRRVSRGGWIDY